MFILGKKIMSLHELTEFVKVPSNPNEIPGQPDWNNIESELGTSLPQDYKDFVMSFGTGLLGEFIRVYNPFAVSEYTAIVPSTKRVCDIFRELKESWGGEEVPFGIHPESPGLLPWGTDENGNFLFWLTREEPGNWICVVGAGRDARWEQFDMSMTTFLAKTLKGDITCSIWPDDFVDPELCRKFSPF